MNAIGYQLDKPVTVRIVGDNVYVVAGHRRRDLRPFKGA